MLTSLMRSAILAFTVSMTLGLYATSARAVESDEYADAVAADEDYAAGKRAIDRKDWAEATKRFGRAALRHPDNADLHNYLGYAYRQLEQFDQAFEHYKRAIAIDPRHRGAHEYIGEAYLLVGDAASAEQHLAALRRICLLPCEELAELEQALARYRARR